MENRINSNAVANNGSVNGGKDMESMNIMAFATEVKQAVSAVLGAECKVEVKEMVKNNGVKLVALVIKGRENNIAPTIYLEDSYRAFKGGVSMGEIICKLIRTYEVNKDFKGFDQNSFMCFPLAKENIYLKLVGADQNEDLLASAPHRIVAGNLAVVYYYELSGSGDGSATITIRNEVLDSWDVTEEELYDIALVNSQRKHRGSVRSITSVLMDMLDEECSSEFFDLMIGGSDMPLYVCTNSTRIFGASAILYDGLLREFSDRLETSNVFIIPSSIHETLLIPADAGMEADYMREMICEVNRTEVSAEERLSDDLYIYHRDTDSIELA